VGGAVSTSFTLSNFEWSDGDDDDREYYVDATVTADGDEVRVEVHALYDRWRACCLDKSDSLIESVAVCLSERDWPQLTTQMEAA
jgi:hypothetical protein